MSNILDHLHDRVLLCDGGTGYLIQAMNLSVEKKFLGKENCTEIFVLTHPDKVRSIHAHYFEAGADCVETNTFGASPLTLAEFGLAGQTLEINQKAVAIAREAAELFSDTHPRFVLGAVGPGTRLPSLGHIDYDSLETAYAVQCAGLMGVDAFLIETCQDPLQIKAAVNGAKRSREKAGKETPIFVQVTVERTGTLLVGTDIAAAVTVVHSLNVPLIGLNCATGPQEMSEHVQWLSKNWPGFVSVQPNAGLPVLVNGQTHYPLNPAELAFWHERFVSEDGIHLVGGCCGTTPEHIRAVDAMLERISNHGRRRPPPVRRLVHWVPAVASLYNQVPLRQENAFLSIGERCNASGSRKFRQYQETDNWDGVISMARTQSLEGSHCLDVCTAFVGRDERADMIEIVSRLRVSSHAPLVIDSTDTAVIETALKLYGGKAIINSIHFEDGEKAAAGRLRLARHFGAAVVALTIDENGMAKTAAEKIRIARRLYDFAVNHYGLPAADLLFDPLTFTICTGSPEERCLAIETLEAIKLLRAMFPECQIMLGVSNVSFGLQPMARHVLNAVFLDHALRRGLTAAIVHVSRLLPSHRLTAEEYRAAEDLIFDTGKTNALQTFIALFQDRPRTTITDRSKPGTVEDRLKHHIINGDRQGLEENLAEALQVYAPLVIINDILLAGMKEIGELFGLGKVQLPFVLQSAETMKTAINLLKPHLIHVTPSQRGTIVLATVRGDVHDIGKNLVDILLTNNGYRVINLGTKQPITAIMAAAREHVADAVGMSGLLVKSTLVMKENLQEMTRHGIEIPVLLGGAALTRRFVEEECIAAYGCGLVAYAQDAFAGLDLMTRVVEGTFSHVTTNRRTTPIKKQKLVTHKKIIQLRSFPEERKDQHVEVPLAAQIPTPPFWGARLLRHVPVRSLISYLNEVTLYRFHWGFCKAGQSHDVWRAWAAQAVRPVLNRMLDICAQETILQPCAAYGYWPCTRSGDSVILFDTDGATEVAHFTFPRQARPDGLCIADFFKSDDDQQMHTIALQVVTLGARASDVARAWFAADRYQDYMYLHGLSVEMTEALAEYVHKLIRVELGLAAEEARDLDGILKREYRGARYSFGYPACPNIADQHKLLALLGADRIGISMSEEDQLYPEQSTSAIVCLHPQAKYFTI